MESRSLSSDDEFENDLITLVDEQVIFTQCKDHKKKDNQGVSAYGQKSVVPLSFLNNHRNIRLIGKCKPMSVQLVDCKIYPWYYKKERKAGHKSRQEWELIKLIKDTKTVDSYKIVERYNEKNPNDKRAIESYTASMEINEMVRVPDTKTNSEVTTTKNNNENAAVTERPYTDFRRNIGLIGMKINSGITIKKLEGLYNDKLNKSNKVKFIANELDEDLTVSDENRNKTNISGAAKKEVLEDQPIKMITETNEKSRENINVGPERASLDIKSQKHNDKLRRKSKMREALLNGNFKVTKKNGLKHKSKLKIEYENKHPGESTKTKGIKHLLYLESLKGPKPVLKRKNKLRAKMKTERHKLLAFLAKNTVSDDGKTSPILGCATFQTKKKEKEATSKNEGNKDVGSPKLFIDRPQNSTPSDACSILEEPVVSEVPVLTKKPKDPMLSVDDKKSEKETSLTSNEKIPTKVHDTDKKTYDLETKAKQTWDADLRNNTYKKKLCTQKHNVPTDKNTHRTEELRIISNNKPWLHYTAKDLQNKTKIDMVETSASNNKNKLEPKESAVTSVPVMQTLELKTPVLSNRSPKFTEELNAQNQQIKLKVRPISELSKYPQIQTNGTTKSTAIQNSIPELTSCFNQIPIQNISDMFAIIENPVNVEQGKQKIDLPEIREKTNQSIDSSHYQLQAAYPENTNQTKKQRENASVLGGQQNTMQVTDSMTHYSYLSQPLLAAPQLTQYPNCNYNNPTITNQSLFNRMPPATNRFVTGPNSNSYNQDGTRNQLPQFAQPLISGTGTSTTNLNQPSPKQSQLFENNRVSANVNSHPSQISQVPAMIDYSQLSVDPRYLNIHQQGNINSRQPNVSVPQWNHYSQTCESSPLLNQMNSAPSVNFQQTGFNTTHGCTFTPNQCNQVTVNSFHYLPRPPPPPYPENPNTARNQSAATSVIQQNKSNATTPQTQQPTSKAAVRLNLVTIPLQDNKIPNEQLTTTTTVTTAPKSSEAPTIRRRRSQSADRNKAHEVMNTAPNKKPKNPFELVVRTSADPKNNTSLIKRLVVDLSQSKVPTSTNPQSTAKPTKVKVQGYSPPILPIPSLEKSLELMSVVQSRYFVHSREPRQSANKSSKPVIKKSVNYKVCPEKRKRTEESNEDKVKRKISICEYKSRMSDTKCVDLTNSPIIPKENTFKDTNGHQRRKSLSENQLVDLGYDSDSTIKLA